MIFKKMNLFFFKTKKMNCTYCGKITVGFNLCLSHNRLYNHYSERLPIMKINLLDRIVSFGKDKNDWMIYGGSEFIKIK